jgi:hypothetical protein
LGDDTRPRNNEKGEDQERQPFVPSHPPAQATVVVPLKRTPGDHRVRGSPQFASWAAGFALLLVFSHERKEYGRD